MLFRSAFSKMCSLSSIVQSITYGGDRRSLVLSPACPIGLLVLRIDDSHYHMIRSFLTAVHCFDNVMCKSSQWLGKNIVRSPGVGEDQERVDRYIGRNDIAEISLKAALNCIQSIKRSKMCSKPIFAKDRLRRDHVRMV